MAEITELMRAASGGDREAGNRLFALLYKELKQVARRSLRQAGRPATLDTTAIVHESFLKLTGQAACTPAERAAFYTYIARVMRTVVLDAFREANAQKRGGGHLVLTLTTGIAEPALDSEQLLAIDDALKSLERLAPQLRELVELRYFAGLTVTQISELTGKPVRSIERDWQKARLLLRGLIEEN